MDGPEGARRWAPSLPLLLCFDLAVGVGLYLGLPVYGYSDADDRAGYVFTDAHNRDDQAWMLATSENPIIDAFSRKYASDQYGGLLAFNALDLPLSLAGCPAAAHVDFVLGVFCCAGRSIFVEECVPGIWRESGLGLHLDLCAVPRKHPARRLRHA